MAFNKEVNDAMERAALEAHDKLLEALNNMTPTERKGARVVIDHFKNNYKLAGYKKLARRIIRIPTD